MNLLYLVRHFVHRPKDFYRVFVISQNAALFQISRYLLSSKSRFGINHTQWHRLFQGKASTIINGIDCYQERHRPLKVASLVYERENCIVAVRWPTTVTSKPNAHSKLQIAHIKFKSLTAYSNRSQHIQITQSELQITHSKLQIAHSIFKSYTANSKSFTANSSRSQQITNY